jgi:tellurite resistance protein TerC
MMDFLTINVLGQQAWMWLAFLTVVVILLVFDLGILHRKTHEISIKESLWLSLFYIVIACIFGGWVWYELGAAKGQEYFTGFIVEKTLALDNIFVISLVFTYFGIPRLYQHRTLFWGILGVIVLRGIMIGVGASLIQSFHWLLYIFALFLIYTGIKMFKMIDDDHDVSQNFVLKIIRKYFRITPELHGERFFVRLPKPNNPNKLITYCTPLFVALCIVEVVDVIFAVDSIPAIFAITTDTYIIYTSNIFAILGLRALYFALAAIIHRFKYLKYSLAFVLIFIGSKVFIAKMLGLEKFPASVSLSVTFALIATGVIYSLYKTKNEGENTNA